MNIEKREMKQERRGRPSKQKEVTAFNPEIRLSCESIITHGLFTVEVLSNNFSLNSVNLSHKSCILESFGEYFQYFNGDFCLISNLLF